VHLVDQNLWEEQPSIRVLNDSKKVWCSGFKTACRKTKALVNEIRPQVLDQEGKLALDTLWEKVDKMEKLAPDEMPASISPQKFDN